MCNAQDDVLMGELSKKRYHSGDLAKMNGRLKAETIAVQDLTTTDLRGMWHVFANTMLMLPKTNSRVT